ncbi:methylated-DNA--[protein]-cysteine S-methyltransferase [Spongisporangium articulatum]|uniref:Methylated-DNA--protein-cysteine methyltransferase n=1 Tax=Spongisporangium articulatum TaxID=3362603 RepID=A0ABW8AI41_9ACTN
MDATATEIWCLQPSPVGDLLLSTDGEALTRLYFTPHKGTDRTLLRLQSEREPDPSHPVLRRTAGQLAEYFHDGRTSFDLLLRGAGSLFQQRVWDALTEIPYGVTESYGSLARRLGLPEGSARAVGLANGANPISIVVPCHRVIGADGSLTGYGGGLERKRFLLDLERGSLF